MTKNQTRKIRSIIAASILLIALMVGQSLQNAAVFQFQFADSRMLILLYLIPYIICGHDVIRKCLIGIKNLSFFDESFLMTLATIGAFVIGEYNEAVAVMLLYQVGELFQDYAVNRSRNSISELMEIAPEYANIEKNAGSVIAIDPKDVRIGDTLIIKSGEKVPVDGIVLSGEGVIDTSPVTGESLPRTVKTGDAIVSGCINGDTMLRVRAEKKYEDSTVSKILELVENASSQKSRTEAFITKFAKWYTPIVVAGAALLAFLPSLLYGNWNVWCLRACTFLVISCPCALVISVPLAFFGGIGAASRIGVLVKGSNFLEIMDELSIIVSDKTGTLTMGEFEVQEIICEDGTTKEELLRKAAAVEALSTHPIAEAVLKAYDGKPPIVEGADNIVGFGIKARMDGKEISVGNAKLMQMCGISIREINKPGTAVYIAEDCNLLGKIVVSDVVKPSTKEFIHEVKRMGVKRFVMLTGDRKPAAADIASKLDIEEFYADLLPADKVEKVEQFMSGISKISRNSKNKGKLAFIGDGINDAPVLMRADVGIAMGKMGSAAAIEAADIVIMDDDINRIPVVMRIAAKTKAIAKQNIAFALAVKIVVLILGAFGIANMWTAVFADVGVAMICILNSMRMLCKGYEKTVVTS